jgi:hypothetical protein
MRRVWLPCLAFALMLAAAGGLTPAKAQSAPAQRAGFSGLWTGTLRVIPCTALRDAARCGAVNKITFTILQDGTKVSGSYTCAIGTQICRNGNADNSGKIVSGNVNGNNLRFSVILPADVSNCSYNGFSPSPGRMRGAYNCYQGGGLIEQGDFQVTREGG